ncbi:MAG: hypothetical protein MJ007_07610 [Paludibacteraceae bacterium]|nr:hypothetical protein [Paludibacteraceae bacterium]
MQKIDAINTQVNTQVTVKHAGVTYKATVLRAPTFKDKDFRPQQFKVLVTDGEWAGNHYVSYTAVHTAEADKAQAERAKAEAEAKAERKEERAKKAAQKNDKNDFTKGMTISEMVALADAIKTLKDCGFDVQFK